MSYFEEIDSWLSALFLGGEDDEGEDADQWFDRVAKEIKAKILESYRNGQKAGLPPEKPVSHERGGRTKFWPKRRQDRGR
jgi:hypothetical protein